MMLKPVQAFAPRWRSGLLFDLLTAPVQAGGAGRTYWNAT